MLIALSATLAVVCGTLTAGVPEAKASAYAGCTYSWGSPCYIVYGSINSVDTMDPDHAYGKFPGAPENGYKSPVYDGISRNVCGTVMAKKGVLGPFGWSCGWGEVFTKYPTTVGYSVIGGGEYYGIALYQWVNRFEYGPCPRGWPGPCS